ncbi:hypothetical protein [Paenibacillus koleovorans]|uniref:hypothetical protein n=1 Tax=Paenibacillus koleovorans TaxID=121608 RepID=UPI000FD70897|nr:hypothetical protein [Paenibacillus koleovorans]
MIKETYFDLESLEEPSQPASLPESLEKQLADIPKERLVSLLLELTKHSESVRQRIRLFVSQSGDKEELVESRKLIRSYIKQASDRHGFVDYNHVHEAVEGAEFVLRACEQAAEDEEWMRAFGLYLCVAKEMILLLQSVDDSDGTVGGLVEDGLQGMLEVAAQREHIPPGQQEQIFRQLIEESSQPYMAEWADWSLHMLEIASKLAISPERRQEWENRLSAAENRLSDRSYYTARIAQLRYAMIVNQDGEEQAEHFIDRHLHLEHFRTIAFQKAMDGSQYERAVQLAEEAIRLESGSMRGYGSKWKRMLFDAYERSGDVAKVRQLSELLLLAGAVEYYTKLKESCPADE